MPKALDVQARLEKACAAVAVLKALQIVGSSMTYKQFATAVGIKSEDEPWGPHHRDQVTNVLNVAAATERQGTPKGGKPLDFKLLVRADTGEPGEGHFKKSRIIRKPA